MAERGEPRTCRMCKTLERVTAAQYQLMHSLGYGPKSYDELRKAMEKSKDHRLKQGRNAAPGKHPKFLAKQGDASALIAARREGRGGLAGPAKSRAMMLAACRRPGGPGWTIVPCAGCGLVMMREAGGKECGFHQPCWHDAQRSPAGQEWMRNGASKPTGRTGKKPASDILTRDFCWTVRRVLGGDTETGLANEAGKNQSHVSRAIKRILALLPPPELAGRSLRRYVVELTAADERPDVAPLRKAVAACGTQSGYKRHRRLGEPVCDDCAEAERQRTRAYSELRRREDSAPTWDQHVAERRSTAKPCGTQAAWQAHGRRGEVPCPACVEANRQYARDKYARRRAAAV